MNKRILLISISLLLVLACALACVACKKTDQCNHSYEWKALDGETHIGLCTECGNKYEEEHSYVGKQCSKCNYIKKDYIITYNTNGGNFLDGSATYTQTVEENSLLAAPTSPVRQGYFFVGWAKSQSGTDMWQFPDDKIKSATILYAVWTEKTAALLSVDGATIDGNSVFMVVDHDTDYVSLATKVICSSDSIWKLYYDRLGVMEIPTKIAKQKSGALYDNENIFYIVVTSKDGMQLNTYELIIHRSYRISVNYIGVYDDTVYSESIYSGYSHDISYNPSIAGYTFNCWKDEEGKKVTSITPYSSATLYADCSVNNYTATFDVNGGEALTSATHTVTYDRDYSFPKPVRIGYTFSGWFVNSDKITDADGNSLTPWKYPRDTELTANWQANKYTVTLNGNQEQAGVMQGDGLHDYDSDVTISAVTYKGYTWIGWYDCNDMLVSSDTSYTFKMGFNTSYTAKWSVNEEMLPFSFVSDINSLSITGVKDKNIDHISLPNYVTSIGYAAFSGCVGLKSIDIPDSITSIGDLAFSGCIGIQSIIIPDSVNSIGNYAFYGCSTLEYLTIPFVGSSKNNDSNTHFGYIFGASSYNDNSRFVPSNLRQIIISGDVTSISSYAFFNCSGLTNITISESVTSIGISAFSGCNGLISIIVPFIGASKKYDGSSHFGYIFGAPSSAENSRSVPSSLKQVIINSGCVSIANSAFSGCSGLTNITLPDGVTTIGDSAFYYCNGLTDITIPDSVTTIGDFAFSGCSSLTSIAIPNGANNIGRYAFNNCSSLTSVIIPFNVIAIGNYAFKNCSNLTICCEVESKPEGWHSDWNISNRPITWSYYKNSGITEDGLEWRLSYISDSIIITGYLGGDTHLIIPDCINDCSVISIGSYAFSNNGELVSVTLPNSIAFIGSYAFSGCSSLTNITLSNSVKSIGEYAFRSCSRLEIINIPESVVYIGENSFSNCNNLIIYCRVKCKPSGWDSNWDYNTFVNNILVVWDIKESGITDNGIKWGLNNSDEIIVAGYSGSGTHITIPEKINGHCVTSIIDYAFSNCTVLTSVITPDNLVSIGNYAFYNCSNLTSITMSKRITYIGDFAFAYCSSLTSIIIPDSIITIGGYVFNSCSNLIIYCEAESESDSWDSNWNHDDRLVIWGYKG